MCKVVWQYIQHYFPSNLCELEQTNQWHHSHTNPMKAFQTWILKYTSNGQDHSIKIDVPFRNPILKDTQYWEDNHVPRFFITHINRHNHVHENAHYKVTVQVLPDLCDGCVPKENGCRG